MFVIFVNRVWNNVLFKGGPTLLFLKREVAGVKTMNIIPSFDSERSTLLLTIKRIFPKESNLNALVLAST